MNSIKKDRYEGGCTTVVIGKAASVTGRVILGHNEDDVDSFVQLLSVPHMTHKDGEMITFPDGSAAVPQVPETLAYYQSEVRYPEGASFGDSFFNEMGVCVVSNSCRPARYDKKERESSGLGYGLRCIVAQRAKTAREGVEILKALVEEYGYISSRCYQIADADECWAVQLCGGHYMAARRIPDDHIYFIPNWFTLHEIDFSDEAHENYYWTPGIDEYAKSLGWYKPESGNGFDFALAFNDTEAPVNEANVVRDRNGWAVLGYEEAKTKEFSLKAKEKYGIDFVKAFLRGHWEGRPDANNINYEKNPHQKYEDSTRVCSPTTVESTVLEFGCDAASLCIWRSLQQPCTNPYIPLYLAKRRVPMGYGSPFGFRRAMETHFCPDEKEFCYDPSKVWWKLKALVWLTELDYAFCHRFISASIRETEERLAIEKAETDIKYKAFSDAGQPEKAAELLSDFSMRKAEENARWIMSMTRTIGQAKYLENAYPKE